MARPGLPVVDDDARARGALFRGPARTLGAPGPVRLSDRARSRTDARAPARWRLGSSPVPPHPRSRASG
jgi:hypothetical protein